MTEQEALDLHAAAQNLQAEGRHTEALPGFEKAAAYFAEADGTKSPDLANVLCDWSSSLLGLCRYAEAEEKARQAVEILAEVADLLDQPSRGSLLPKGYAAWGRSLRELGRYEEASEPLKTAIAEAEHGYGADHVEVSSYLNEYGILCKYWGRFDEGERTYLRALAMLEREFGKESLETATLYHNLGGLEHSRHDFVKGEPLGRVAYEIRRRAEGEDSPGAIADAVAWCGLLDGLGRYAESEPVYRRALNYYEKRCGPDHFEVAAVLNNLGLACAAKGDTTEARKLLKRCLAIKRKLFAEDHPEVKLSLQNLQSI